MEKYTMSPTTKLGDRITAADMRSMSKSDLLKLVDPFAKEYNAHRQANRLSGISLTDYVKSCLVDEGVLQIPFHGQAVAFDLPETLVEALKAADATDERLDEQNGVGLWPRGVALNK
jgi:hypothetical protein